MSESIVRKVQPFTIGTRLSVPAVPKCQEFSQTYTQSQSLDNCTLQHNLNSLYLSRSQVCARGPCLDPVEHRREDMAAEDHLNQNVAAAVSRSIKKITISGSKERSQSKMSVVAMARSVNNNNNNNITAGTSDPHLPRIVGVNWEKEPSSHFKVLVKTPSGGDHQLAPGQTRLKVNGERSVPQILEQEKEAPTKESYLQTHNQGSADVSSPSDFTQRTSVFTKEVLQADAWIKSKLQDLKEGSKIQRCPLQDWEEASQTLQRDLKDFENTLIQLNQTGDQLTCKLNPAADLVKKQLSQLRDQWQVLKQTAANQTRALGGAKNLQEFYKKVEQLEAWIKEKEEERSLVDVLGPNVDKMQLTKRILDLKQDEQLHRNLHEEINHLALRLEKQGKTDGKSISSRRKHINKMWLKVQSHLTNYHQNLQLALEVSSFYQQADNVLCAINIKKKSLSASDELDLIAEREIRDIASQIMMLDVSVSQLSSLHPILSAGVAQKQSEVKDCWALLQRVFRSDRTTGSPFTREAADPLTQAPELKRPMGTETQGIMGKEAKEGQNRLKGCVSTLEWGSGGRNQRSVNHTAPPLLHSDVMGRHPPKGESRKPRVEPKPASALRGHPQLHIQLQKFTVSADKTLSWLKDNVSMATRVCSVASSEGLEAARRCQHAVEQEILTNKARIEVVKREGRGLVRAQHPGSAKIEEFLRQLEVLWEELRRRHQRNAVFLQASEELGLRVVKVLQALGSLEAWLDSVELSMKASSPATDPRTMTVAERESCLLEEEVAARGMELSALRQEVDRLHDRSHTHTPVLSARMEEVERKYHHVLSALTQQSSELQDTRMLTEFLERVELEESQEPSGRRYSLGQPLRSEISTSLQSSGGGGPLIASMGDPVEELREAVEMLNDTVRERGRTQSHDQAVQELLSKHARLAVCVEECLCSSKELSLDVLEKETDLAVQCEPERCGLEALKEKRDRLETDYEVIREEIKEMENQASRLKELCPERVHALGAKIQATLRAWTELEKSVTENRSRLREFVLLQDFFRSYLAMISWTEDTRSCIFSDSNLHLGRDGQRPLAAKLDVQIEQKFEEFDELAATGRNILDKDHHLSQMVRERMEELCSMLGWISVHWRAKKQQWLHDTSGQESAQDNVYSEATMCSSFETSEDELLFQSSAPDQTAVGPSDQNKPKAEGFGLFSEQQDEKQQEDGYEVMNSIGPRGAAAASEPPQPSVVVLKEPGSPSLGGTVNLILSFANAGDGHVQELDLPARTDEAVEGTSEPVHRPTLPARKNFWKRCQGLLENTLGSLKRKRKIYQQSANEVSTYLHVKENNLAAAPVYESITLPRQKRRSAASASPAASPSSSSSSPAPPAAAGVSFHSLTRSGSSSIFSSLRRMGKKRKRKRDARRHTIQKIMGVEEETDEPHYACETLTYDTRTWPLKDARRKRSSAKSEDGAEAPGYVKNPLLEDIDTDCAGDYAITPYAVSEGPSSQVRGHCRFLSLGSVLSFDLPKDMSLIPSIQDIITIAPPESKTGSGSDPDPLSQRHSALSSFRRTRPTAPCGRPPAECSLCDSTPHCGPQPPPPSPGRDADPTVPSDDLSRTHFGLQEGEEQEWDRMPAEVKIPGRGQLPIYVNQTPASAAASQKHPCPSVHTLIRDLNGHRYHRSAGDQRPGSGSNPPPHAVLNLKSTASVRQDSVDSGVSSSGSVKLCSEAPCVDTCQPRAVVGRFLPQNKNTPQYTDEPEKEPVHLDRQQFEEEEEELEDIWNQTTNHRQSICSDIMYQPHQDGSAADQAAETPPCPADGNAPAVLYRNLATASAPDLLVAEFRLPAHVQSCRGPRVSGGDRRSWAAFPNREHGGQTSVAVNETASDPLQLPEVEDNQRYVYQYREEEEEERDEGEEDHSMSLLSLRTSSDGVGPQREGSLGGGETQYEMRTTGGRCDGLSLQGVKPELQAMEGPLERKHKLQLGGKKAASRGWNSFHAVLYRHTLCFYQDRKDTLRSTACGLPLNLLGAECSPAPDYTKKPNCFCLRLRDGSEYLLNASSRFMMRKWMMKIQASTGPSDSAASSISVHRDFSVSSRPPYGATHAKEVVVLAREFSHMSQGHLRSVDEWSRTSPSHEAEDEPTCASPVSSAQDWLSSKRRSHSFTSATYQKIKSTPHPPGGGGASNYSVTLVVGDTSSDGTSSMSRRLQQPLTAAGWQQDATLRSFASLPRPHNKSVLKKFFGRKDL